MSIFRALDGSRVGALAALPFVAVFPLVAVLSLVTSSAEATPAGAPVLQTKAPAPSAAKPIVPPASKPVLSITLAEPTATATTNATTMPSATTTGKTTSNTTTKTTSNTTTKTSSSTTTKATSSATTSAAVTHAGTMSATATASSSKMPAGTSGRSFIIGMKPGDGNSVRMIELVVMSDPENPKVATSCELRVGQIGKPADQVLTFKVDAGVDTILASADVVDLNFDGLRDFWVMREAGAKWSRYEAFVWDGRTGRFVKDAFAREISQLDNPEYDEASKSFVSSSFGPSEPYRTVRKVQGGHTVVVESCAFHNGKDTNQDDQNEGLLVVQKVVGNALKTTQKQISIKLTENPCAPTPTTAAATTATSMNQR